VKNVLKFLKKLTPKDSFKKKKKPAVFRKSIIFEYLREYLKIVA
jgi:hypothetical protein